MCFESFLIFILFLATVPLQFTNGDPRKSFMCKCVSERRGGGGSVPQDPKVDIPDITSNPALTNCFEFRLAYCPSGGTNEHLGAVFIQNPCPGAPLLKTLDIAVIAINENGYPYGKLAVNKDYVQACQFAFSPPSPTGSDILNYRPTLHDLYPVDYVCNDPPLNLSLVEYGGGTPWWLSIDLNFDPVAAGEAPKAVQFFLVENVQKKSKPWPKNLEFIAEFATKQGTSSQTYRIHSERRTLAYSSGFVSYMTSTVLPTPVVLNPEYLEDNTTLPTCKTPLPLPPQPSPAPNPSYIICRHMEGEPSAGPAPNDRIKSCIKITFKNDPSSSNFFYMSVEKTGTCADKIFQVTFTVMIRDTSGTKVGGTWQSLAVNEYAGKCEISSSSPKPKSPSNKNIQDCPSGGSSQLFYHWAPLETAGDIICAKWIRPKGLGRVEIQAGFKLYYGTSPTSLNQYSARSEELYHVLSNTLSTIKTSPNPRIDLILATPPVAPPLVPPEYRKTFMCACASPRRYGSPITVVPTAEIPDLTKSPTLASCFEFKMANCPNSKTDEALGAIFIQKHCPAMPNLKTVDLSVIAVNQNGYAYGKLKVNQVVHACQFEFSRTGPSPGSPAAILDYKPVLHELKPVDYECKQAGLDLTLVEYRGLKPWWISIDANLGPVSAGKPPAAIQVVLEKTVKSTPPYPRQLQFIAEFAITDGTKTMTYRLRTEHRMLTFSGTKVNYGDSVPLAFDAEVNTNYLEDHSGGTCLGPGLPANPPLPLPNPDYIICRHMEGEAVTPPTAPPFSDNIKNCIKISFTNDPASANDFYMSLEKTGTCSESIHQVSFTTLVRDKTGTRVDGTWKSVAVSEYSGKCGATASPSNPRPPSKANIQNCPGGTGGGMAKVFYNYESLEKTGDIICAKWTKPASTTHMEIQAGFKLYYGSGATSTNRYQARTPEVYEVISNKVSKVAQGEANPRIDLIHNTPPTNPTLFPPLYRNTYMCKCVTPRRFSGSVTQDPLKPIPDISTAAALASCFEFKLAHCPKSETAEQLGAIFIQKPCSGAPALKTVDLSVIAINQNGYPYGKLKVNTFIQACVFTGGSTPPILGYKPVLHDQKPVEYECTNTGLDLGQVEYGNKQPWWISIDTSLGPVPPGQPPMAIQIVLEQAVMGPPPHPTELQFIAEFSVMNGGGAPVTYRMNSDHLKLSFSGGKVNWGATTPISTPITVSSTFLEEYTVGFPLPCVPPLPLPKPPSPPPNPNWIICRHMQGEQDNPSTAPPFDNSIKTCIKVSFKPDPSSPLTFYMSVEKTGSCSDTIYEIAFTTLTRDETTTKVSGTWSYVPESDYASKCPSTVNPSNPKSEPSRKSIQSCPGAGAAAKLYYNFRLLEQAGDIICAKWTMSPFTKRMEVQAGYKMYYGNPGNKKSYQSRTSEIYDVLSATSVIKVSDDPLTNPRVDLILNAPPPALPVLYPPIIRKSHMCKCTSPRRSNSGSSPVDATKDIPHLSTSTTLRSCFEFRLAHCPNSHTNEHLGAIFIQKECSAAPSLHTVDLSVIAINENGYPYGKLVVNTRMQLCEFDSSPAPPTPEILNYKLALHELEPVIYECDNKDLDLDMVEYGKKKPWWLSINAVLGPVAAGMQPHVLQIVLSDQVQTSGAKYPSNLQFVAEFSVKQGTGSSIETYRLTTDHIKLAFSGGKVSLSTSPSVPTDITTSLEYLEEVPTGGTATCSTPKPLPRPPPPIPDKNHLICRFMQGEEKTPPTSPTEYPSNLPPPTCFNFQFLITPTPNVFYLRLEKPGGAVCSNFKITQLVFAVLGRDQTGATTPLGKFDLIPEIHLGTNCGDGSPPVQWKRNLGLSLQDCPGAGANNRMLYYYYKTMENGEAICAQWTMPPIPAGSGKVSPFKEIQAGFKMFFLSGAASYKYVVRSEEIYEITPAKTGAPQVIKLADKTNPRVDLIMYKPPVLPPLKSPVPRNTYMCTCKRRRDPDNDPKNPVEFDHLVTMPNVADSPELRDCFEFKWVECPLSSSAEALGAQFIQKPCSRYSDLRTLDVNVVAINEKGYPYGELLVNKIVRPCFSSSNEVLTFHPFIHKLDVVDLTCPGLDVTQVLYDGKDPYWHSVMGDFKVGSGKMPAVLQFFFKERIQTPTKPHPKSLQLLAEFAVETSKSPRETMTYRITTSNLQLAFGSDGKVNVGGSTALPQSIKIHWDYLDEILPPSQNVLGCDNPPTFVDPMPPNPAWVICRFMQGEEVVPPVIPPFEDRIKDCFKTSFKNEPTNSKDFYMSLERISGAAACDSDIIEQLVFSVLLRDKDGNTRIGGQWEQVTTSDYGSKCSATPIGSLNPLPSSTKNKQLCKGVGNEALFFNFRFLAKVGDIICGKWTLPTFPSGTTVMEVQPAYKMYFGVAPQKFTYFGRHPEIYEVLPDSSGASQTVAPVSQIENERVDILLRDPPDFDHANPLVPSVTRKSHMCRCSNPRRTGGTPVLIYKDIPTFDPGSSTPPCFEIKFANCPHANLGEDLGAVFIQNPCASLPRLIDVSFVALNDEGHPYGMLRVNEFIRACDFGPSPPPAGSPLAILQYQPILHKIKPVNYVCNDPNLNHDKFKYGNKIPEWLSIAADTTVKTGDLPVAIQVILLDPVGGTSPHPSTLKIVSEFSVEEAGVVNIYRMETESVEISSGAGGKVPWPVTPSSTPIEASYDYLDEEKPACLPPNPQSAPVTTPPGQSEWLTCNCFDWEQTPPRPGPQTPKPKVTECIDVILNYPDSPSPPFTFFMSIAKTDAPTCANVQIINVIFVMLVRSPTSTNVYKTDLKSTWAKVNDKTDYISGLCARPTSPSPIKSQITGKFHTQTCASPRNTPIMYNHYRSMKDAGDMICAKWTLGNVGNGVTEIQGGYKLLYLDGATKFSYITKHPEIYEVRRPGTYQVTKVCDKKNPRVDLLLPVDLYPTTFTNCIPTPFIPSSDVCDCLQTRHGGFVQNPPSAEKSRVLNFTLLNFPSDCVTFEMVKCTEDGILYDTIGALLVFDPDKCGSIKYTVDDISFQALNQEGYPFGEALHSNFLRTCLTPDTIMDYKVKNLMFANPKEGSCDGKVGAAGTIVPEFHYPGVPSWVSVKANLHIEFMGKKKVAFQIYLKKPCPSSPGCNKFTPVSTHVQFTAEMYVRDRTGANPPKSAIYKMKTKVYQVSYDGSNNFQVGTPFEPTTEPDLLPSPEFYETFDPKCNSKVTPLQYKPLPSQHCGCWRFTNDDPAVPPTPPGGKPPWTRLLPNNPIHKNFNACINFIDKEVVPTSPNLSPRPNDLRFFLTVWTPINPTGDECKDIDITLSVITALKQTRPKSTSNLQKGMAHGEFKRATRYLGEDCPVPATYPPPNSVLGASSVLRRPPPSFTDTCVKPETGSSEMFFLPYPLDEQEDKRNGFCVPWTVPEESACCGTPAPAPTQTRFEFQFVGEFAVLDTSVKPPKQYYAMKRTMVYEHAPVPLTPSPTPYPFWGRKMFPVQEASLNPKSCDTDICLLS
ncbi:unnamed protein product [Orchesella dallaii]|uniref:Uncharacterized protein n=1 Tax=Orchesella dallaii TaxID=48710 RepID=A0ABP1RT58_9HEXA